MGLINRMVDIRNAKLGKAPESKGQAVLVDGSTGSGARTMELWGQPGVWSVPPDGTHGIRHPVGGSDKWGAVIGTHHYGTTSPTLDKGETAIGSTNSDGSTLMARATFYADGKMTLSNQTKNILTILNGFVDAVSAAVTSGGQTMDPATIAALNAVKVQLALLFKVPV